MGSEELRGGMIKSELKETFDISEYHSLVIFTDEKTGPSTFELT